jgi:hypothetical protein
LGRSFEIKRKCKGNEEGDNKIGEANASPKTNLKRD